RAVRRDAVAAARVDHGRALPSGDPDGAAGRRGADTGDAPRAVARNPGGACPSRGRRRRRPRAATGRAPAYAPGRRWRRRQPRRPGELGQGPPQRALSVRVRQEVQAVPRALGVTPDLPACFVGASGILAPAAPGRSSGSACTATGLRRPSSRFPRSPLTARETGGTPVAFFSGSGARASGTRREGARRPETGRACSWSAAGSPSWTP